MTENEISYIVRGAVFEIYNHFGPGLFESVYKQALFVQLTGKGLSVQKEVGIIASYLGNELGLGFRMDLLVENKVIVEVKSIEALSLVHHKQLLTYLRLTSIRLGLLINFNTSEISSSITRIVNKL